MSRVKANAKRDSLISAANKLIYEQTFHITTLADIAKEADVPLGNVYYYFKTKEAILDAVLKQRAAEWHTLFSDWENLEEAKDRLQGMMAHWFNKGETLARFGCMIGSLCQELGKQGGQMAASSAALLTDILQWVQKQFAALGKDEEQATRLAEYFIASLQGTFLLASTFKEPTFLDRQNKILGDWLTAL